MKASRSLIITTIAPPNKVLRSYAEECQHHDIDFIIVGDKKSPSDFNLAGSDYWNLDRQKASDFTIASIIPENHYARKNIGYIIAMDKGHEMILETDDDNLPYETFWRKSEIEIEGRQILNNEWINIFSLFTGVEIWPRGFPLEYVANSVDYKTDISKQHHCPIQQGLANENPDVDAVFRLTRKLPLVFQKDLCFVLGQGCWCPFNSQNTVWFREAFPLMYLPSFCSFRMTDIWRSFIAQRIAWEYGWKVAFYSPTVFQERNEHNLLRDFEDEIPGYLNNLDICKELDSLTLSDKPEDIYENLAKCYERLIEMDLVGNNEMDILKQWTYDLQQVL